MKDVTPPPLHEALAAIERAWRDADAALTGDRAPGAVEIAPALLSQLRLRELYEQTRVLAERRAEGAAPRDPPVSRGFTLLELARAASGDERAELLRWVLSAASTMDPHGAAVLLSSAAQIAAEPERAALLAGLEDRLGRVGDDVAVSVMASLLPCAHPGEALEWARRGLRAMASGAVSFATARRFLGAIPAETWPLLGPPSWGPALARATSDGGQRFDPRLLSIPALPQAIRDIIERDTAPLLLAGDPARAAAALLDVWPGASPALRTGVLERALQAPSALWSVHGSKLRAFFRQLDGAALERVAGAVGKGGDRCDDAIVSALAEAFAARGDRERANESLGRIADDDVRHTAALRSAVAARARDGERDRARDREDIAAAAAPLLAGGGGSEALIEAARALSGTSDGEWFREVLRGARSAEQRLLGWTALFPGLPAPARESLFPAFVAAAEEALSEGRDRAIAAAMPLLPDSFLLRFWRARASFSAYRPPAESGDGLLFGFLEDSHFLHADWIAHLLARLAGSASLVDFGASLQVDVAGALRRLDRSEA